MWRIWYYPSAKKTKIIFSRKIHLQVTFPVSLKNMIFILENMLFLLKHIDWHSRLTFQWFPRVPMILCTFMVTFYRRFYILFFQQKRTGNLIYRIEVWLLFQFIWLEIFYDEESSILCTIQPSGITFKGVIEH